MPAWTLEWKSVMAHIHNLSLRGLIIKAFRVKEGGQEAGAVFGRSTVWSLDTASCEWHTFTN